MSSKEKVYEVHFDGDGYLDTCCILPDSTPEFELGIFDYGDEGYVGRVRAKGQVSALDFVTHEVHKLRTEKDLPGEPFYVTTYCNFAHRTRDGKPIDHECRIIPPSALQAEIAGDFETAQYLLSHSPVKMMRRGVKN